MTMNMMIMINNVTNLKKIISTILIMDEGRWYGNTNQPKWILQISDFNNILGEIQINQSGFFKIQTLVIFSASKNTRVGLDHKLCSNE